MSELAFTICVGRQTFTTTFTEGREFLNAMCDCPAGKYGNFCQHRLDSLEGKTGGIVSDNQQEIGKLKEWLVGTRLEKALETFYKAARELTDARELNDAARLDDAEAVFKAAKRGLSIAMHQ